jgi:hypothetical protein
MQGSVIGTKALDLIEVAHFASRKIVEKEVDRSNATVLGDAKIVHTSNMINLVTATKYTAFWVIELAGTGILNAI